MIKLNSIYLIASMLLSGFAISAEKDLLLIGGGLKICSSYSTKNCNKAVAHNKRAYTQSLYTISQNKIALIKTDPLQVFRNSQIRSKVVSLLKKYTLRNREEKLSRKELLRNLDTLKLTETQESGRAVLDSLSPKEWNFVLHHLTEPVTDQQGNALTEFVNIENSDPYSIEIINRFVELVSKRAPNTKPLILVSTSSANNPFDAVSFYIQLFKNYDVEVAWFPLDANLNQILHSHLPCDKMAANRAKKFHQFNRENLYPQLHDYQLQFCRNPKFLEELLEQASGLFFNGGDQFLTLNSFAKTNKGSTQFSKYYTTLKNKFDSGKLVIAGTSAGSAVQSGGIFEGSQLPMITNGPSLNGFFNGSIATSIPPSKQCEFDNNCDKNTSVNSLTTFRSGGFNFLPIGIIDTHFSERDRMFRLLRLLADHQVTRGYGIDENTALHVRQANGKTYFEAFGQSAVWQVKIPSLSINSVKLEATSSREKASNPIKAEVQVMTSRVMQSGEQWNWLGDDIIANLIKRASSAKKQTAVGKLTHKENEADIILTIDASARGAKNLSLEIH